MSRARLTQLVTDLAVAPDIGSLSLQVMSLVQRAWSTGDVVFPRQGSATLGSAIGALGPLAKFGDVDLEEVLRRGAVRSAELDVLAVLALLGAAANWPAHTGEQRDLAKCFVWLETFTGLRLLSVCDAVLDSGRILSLADGILRLVESDALTGDSPSYPQLRIGLAWVMSCPVPECAELASRAGEVATRIAPSVHSGSEAPLQGELGPRPRSPWVLALFAITGILFLLRAARALARLLLLRRVSTSTWLSERGLELFLRYELLGRVLKERRIFVPIADIRTVEREVRFPRFGLYAGLCALAIGTLLGSRLFVEGLRVAGLSFPMMVIGIGLVVIGVVFDALLSGIGGTARGRCRLVVTPYRGTAWAIGNLRSGDVDRLLDDLSARLATRHS